jgi:hypothetical protein
MNCKLTIYNESAFIIQKDRRRKECIFQAPTDLGHHVDIVLLADAEMIRSGFAAFESLPDL